MFPLWLKLAATIPVVIILGIYWIKYGPGNFLWFSDIAMIGAVSALWLENSLIASTQTVAVLLPELVWNISFFGQLLTGKRVTGLTDYMFEPQRPLYLKALSLFHVPLTPLLVWIVWRLGYDPRALVAAALMCWIVLPLCYWFTSPQRNVNWVRGPGGEGTVQKFMPPLAWVGFLMFVVFPLIYLPTHFLLKTLFS